MDDHPTPNTNINTASPIALAFVIVIVAVVNYSLPGFDFNPVVAGAVGVIITWIIGLFVKPQGGSS